MVPADASFIAAKAKVEITTKELKGMASRKEEQKLVEPIATKAEGEN
jgi:hypothetical protein